MKAKCEEAGVIFCRDQLEYPGDGFQYLCNILDTGFLSTVEGMKWQNDFINGDATVSGTPEMMESLQLLERRRNLGMLNGDGTPDEDNATRMSYLSEDGNQNVFVLNVSRYVGLNKDLGENEKKLKDEEKTKISAITAGSRQLCEEKQYADNTKSRSVPV